jgi:hypothetical protein
MKLCLCGYVAPPSVGHPEAFLRNLARFKHTTDLILYSEHPWPDTFRLKGSPEAYRSHKFPDGRPNKFCVQNGAFFTGVRIAHQRGYTHMITLEDDVRVGCDDWDSRMWDEYFALTVPAVAAGTLATYNPCNVGPEATRRWNELLRRNTRKNFPIATYGWLGAGIEGPSAVFPNGALAIYDLRWLAKFFDLEKTAYIASAHDAWDFAIGFKIWDYFKEQSYDMVGMLECIFSGYKNLVISEEERIDMLKRGDVVAVHHVKTDWIP